MKKRGTRFISALLLLLPFYPALLDSPQFNGDWQDYWLTLEALAARGSPAIQREDMERTRKLLERFAPESTYYQEVLSHWEEVSRSNDGESERFVFKKISENAWIVPHFWAYSALTLPIKALLKIFQLNDLKAFQIVNALWLFLVMAYCLFFCRLPLEAKARFFLASGFLLSGPLYYLKWMHPEVMTACLLFLAALLLLERRSHWASLFSAIASLQNPPAAIFTVFLVAISLLQGSKLKFRWPLCALSLVLLCTPYLYYYAHLGILNPVVHYGFWDLKFLGVDRFISFFFDLNQGVIAGAPGILVGTLIFGFYKVFKWGPKTLLFWMPVLMSLAVLPQVQWNHGQAVFSRYATWIIAPWVVLIFSQPMITRKSALLILSLLASQLICHWEYDGWNADPAAYCRLKGGSRWVLNHFPQAYNPDPEIFIERVRGQEEKEIKKLAAIGEELSPVVYQWNGVFKKIAFHKNRTESVQLSLCPNEKTLRDKNQNRPVSFRTTRFGPSGWGYLSGSFVCAVK